MVLQRAITNAPAVANLVSGSSTLLSVNARFDQQNYYSHITGSQPTFLGFLGGGSYTKKNTFASEFFRPFNFLAKDSEDGSIKDSVDSKVGSMFGNMVTYTCELIGWRDSGGNLFKKNTMITITAPEAMIYTEYTFLISKVIFERTPDQKKTRLELTLPGSYSGELPSRLPWG